IYLFAFSFPLCVGIRTKWIVDCWCLVVAKPLPNAVVGGFRCHQSLILSIFAFGCSLQVSGTVTLMMEMNSVLENCVEDVFLVKNL
ncbi:hypothetical protein A2U01_0052119, partial [Trifolium medium]|nr:hypothetical protein [Trifolium medium]